MNALRTTHIKVLRMPQLTERIGLARSTIYDKLDPKSPRYDKTFPRPFKIGSKAIGWNEQSIDEWLELQMNNSLAN